jgi:hypothetical protein
MTDPTQQQSFSSEYWVRASSAGYTEMVLNRDRSVVYGWIASAKHPNGQTITAHGGTTDEAQRRWCEKVGV